MLCGSLSLRPVMRKAISYFSIQPLHGPVMEAVPPYRPLLLDTVPVYVPLCALSALSAYLAYFSQFRKDPYENQNFFRGLILALFWIVKHFSAGLLKARLS